MANPVGAFNCATLLLSFLLIIAVISAQSDVVNNIKSDGATFYSKNHGAIAVLASHGTEYLVSSKNHKSYSIKVSGSPKIIPNEPYSLWLGNGEAYLSEDGATLVWLKLRGFVGHLKLDCVEAFSKEGKAEGFRFISPPGYYEQNLSQPALAVFKDGKLIKTYSLGTLLVRPVLVGETGEMTLWIRPGLWPDDERRFPEIKDPALSNDGRKFTFTTTSFRKYVIDTSTGDIIQDTDTKFWQKAGIIIWGKFTKNELRKNVFKVEISEVLKGKVTNPQITVYDKTKTYGDLVRNVPVTVPLWTGAVLTMSGERYEITESVRNFPVHVEPW